MATAAQWPYLTVEQTVGTYPIGNHAVTARNLYVLLSRRYRGEDRTIPGQEGDEPYEQVLASGEHLIELLIKGSVNSDGVRAADPEAQLFLTMQELVAATGPFGADGTRACVLHFPDGSTTVSADCHVNEVEFLNGDGPNMVATVLVKVPAGKYV